MAIKFGKGRSIRFSLPLAVAFALAAKTIVKRQA
jgi:hypothetical protein